MGNYISIICIVLISVLLIHIIKSYNTKIIKKEKITNDPFNDEWGQFCDLEPLYLHNSNRDNSY